MTPLGKLPVWLKVAAGDPVAITAKLPTVPTVNVVPAPLVMAGAWFTVSVKI